jgi:hypothetical protein
MLTNIVPYSAVCRSEDDLYLGSSPMVSLGVTNPTVLETPEKLQL